MSVDNAKDEFNAAMDRVSERWISLTEGQKQIVNKASDGIMPPENFWPKDLKQDVEVIARHHQPRVK